MKAIVYDGIQKIQCRNVPDPKIEKDDDIIIKVTSTAICGSDLHLVHGPVKVPDELTDEQVLFLTDILPTS